MTLTKGTIIKKIQTNNHPYCESANTELVYIVKRVNKTSYSLQCIEGYMKNTECKLTKDFKEESIDIYGTVTKYVVIR